jgi:hypothetical protein
VFYILFSGLSQRMTSEKLTDGTVSVYQLLCVVQIKVHIGVVRYTKASARFAVSCVFRLLLTLLQTALVRN